MASSMAQRPLSRPSPEQLALIDRFIAAYNAIDRQLRFMLGTEDEVSFAQLVRRYCDKHPNWRSGGETLLQFTSVRNALIHNATEPTRYLSVPLPGVVEQIEHIRDSLRNPERVIPKFQRRVAMIGPDEPLSKALQIIYGEKFSQLPVYDHDAFKGVLTENGITRWLARHVADELELVDLSEVPVRKALREEEKRPNHAFVPSGMSVQDVVGQFSTNPELEVVLITAGGKRTERPLGIITAWDIAHLG